MTSTKALSAPNAAAIARQRASTRSALTEYYRSRIR
jgi:hypothetical protein